MSSANIATIHWSVKSRTPHRRSAGARLSGALDRHSATTVGDFFTDFVDIEDLRLGARHPSHGIRKARKRLRCTLEVHLRESLAGAQCGRAQDRKAVRSPLDCQHDVLCFGLHLWLQALNKSIHATSGHHSPDPPPR